MSTGTRYTQPLQDEPGESSTDPLSPTMGRQPSSISARSLHSLHSNHSATHSGGYSTYSHASGYGHSPDVSLGQDDARSARSLSSQRGRHRRTVSGASALSMVSHGSDVVSPEDFQEKDPVVFVEPPTKNLFCLLCQRVFREPVLCRCGHTFCRGCVAGPHTAVCPVHHTSVTAQDAFPNLVVKEQVDDLLIHCKYGLQQSVNHPGKYEVAEDGCKQVFRLGSRLEHEQQCPFMPVQCPNSTSCGPLIKAELEEHLSSCPYYPCIHHKRGCKFVGTKAEVDQHIKSCKFEHVRDILEENDAQMAEMREAIEARDQDVAFLRGMLVKLSERVDTLEQGVSKALGALDQHLSRLWVEFEDARRTVNDNCRDLAAIQAKLGLVGDIGIIKQSHKIKCQGTFVGHQGPVWAMAAVSDLLFSGSSDEKIKVWDIGTNLTCRRTLHAHRGIIHALVVAGHQLFSGSSDGLIKAWHIDTLELIHTLEGHDNPVCALVVTNGVLFSGSLKVIKMWDVHEHHPIGEITGLNHWVRALAATDEHLFAGSYQTVTVFSCKMYDEKGNFQLPQQIRVLPTSGGSIYSLCVSPQYVMCGTYEAKIHLWDMSTFRLEETLSGHEGTVYSLVHVHDGKGKGRLFSASSDKSIRVWNLDNYTCVQTLERHENSVDCLVIQKGRIFSGAADSTIKVWQ